jgi:hypothetical protein
VDIAPFGGRCCVFATPIAEAASKKGVCPLRGCEHEAEINSGKTALEFDN